MKFGLGGVVAVLVATGAMACSSAKSPSADGNMQVRFSANPANPTVCKNVRNAQITSKNGQAPNHATNTPGGRVEDGSEGYSVSCKVHGSKDFTVSGTLNGGTTSFSFSGNVTKGGTGSGVINEYDTQAQTTVSSPSDQLCTFTVTPDPLQVAPGRIWATFDCPSVLDESNPTATDCAATGEFVFENCSE